MVSLFGRINDASLREVLDVGALLSSIPFGRIIDASLRGLLGTNALLLSLFVGLPKNLFNSTLYITAGYG